MKTWNKMYSACSHNFFKHMPHDTKEDGVEGIYRLATQT